MNIDFSRSIQIHNPLWWASQSFALVALICFIWGWSIRNKVKMMVLIGVASLALAASAPFLGNFSLGVLFGLAAIRNFVFAYIDNRKAKGGHVAAWVPMVLAAVFALLTILSTVILVHVLRVDVQSVWLEWLICITLLGLILGNILKGTLVMRLSFMANRTLNIINHFYFGNLISVIIASLSIGSILLYYIRAAIAYDIKKHALERLEKLRQVQRALFFYEEKSKIERPPLGIRIIANGMYRQLGRSQKKLAVAQYNYAMVNKGIEIERQLEKEKSLIATLQSEKELYKTAIK